MLSVLFNSYNDQPLLEAVYFGLWQSQKLKGSQVILNQSESLILEVIFAELKQECASQLIELKAF